MGCGPCWVTHLFYTCPHTCLPGAAGAGFLEEGAPPSCRTYKVHAVCAHGQGAIQSVWPDAAWCVKLCDKSVCLL